VTTASSGEEALALLDRVSFDVILSDIRMPGLDGPGFYHHIETARPELVERIAFMTGDTLAPGVRSFLDQAGRPRLEKPFTPSDARALLNELVVGKSAA
jgi:CheY-like chemotaxis protein